MLRPQEAIPAAIPAGNTPWKVPLLPMKLPKAQGITHHKCLRNLTTSSCNKVRCLKYLYLLDPLGTCNKGFLPYLLIQSRVPNLPSIATRLQAGENLRQIFKVPAGPWRKRKQVTGPW